MESKTFAMMMNLYLMIVMVMGCLLVQTEAKSSHFKLCYSDCHAVCKSHTTFPKSLLCPFTCLMTCLVPTLPTPSPASDTSLTNKIDHTENFCKLGCATHHCVSLSSLQNPNVEKVATCVDSCSEKCSKEMKK
ncbi:unnamed protein product [Arabidopsis thaliana]|uniref:Plant thionin family protein n=1 Tax=Arabidopsis thaliana TaxID=3702 RepID=A0A654EA38_ARATH|nr:unnamed protein product [Arabidopsis thaliana]